MEEVRLKYETLVKKKEELKSLTSNARQSVEKLKQDVNKLSHEVNKQYLIEKCSCIEKGKEVAPITEQEAIRILHDLENHPALIDEVIVALTQRKAVLTGQLSHLQESLQKVTETENSAAN